MTRDQVDCIVRFHDINRLRELDRCIFSLVGQRYRPLNIILALQRFSAAEIATVREALAPLLAMPDAPQLTICNLEQAVPQDGRTLLLNMGLQAATGRYVGFLDYDDVLYPEAYETIVARLRETDAAVAFATVRVVSADIHKLFIRVVSEMKEPFQRGDHVIDLFRSNFCPIHSFLVDRNKMSREELFFDTALTWEEDYDFLLRICARHRSDFGLISTRIGDYYFKNDGSNSIPTDGIANPAQQNAYEKVCAAIETRRRTMLVSPGVQAENGIVPPQPGMTIRSFLERFGHH
ncbi:glycosyltransferase [Roseicella aerolata]|uniref:Glycosyltransferase n=1 Tax=Roseicella aerolata TaxID=2883479 RepID=A0A9X1IIM0_9PROT|nr:glycosyltransferase [Roseicella aerolata]MCB4825212.1 glycosyltransferase [Roseicella aerolata]